MENISHPNKSSEDIFLAVKLATCKGLAVLPEDSLKETDYQQIVYSKELLTDNAKADNLAQLLGLSGIERLLIGYTFQSAWISPNGKYHMNAAEEHTTIELGDNQVQITFDIFKKATDLSNITKRTKIIDEKADKLESFFDFVITTIVETDAGLRDVSETEVVALLELLTDLQIDTN